MFQLHILVTYNDEGTPNAMLVGNELIESEIICEFTTQQLICVGVNLSCISKKREKIIKIKLNTEHSYKAEVRV